jgi:hypothetical protein
MTVAGLVVAIELLVVAWVRHKYMGTRLLPAAVRVVIGGVIVFLAGAPLGSS